MVGLYRSYKKLRQQLDETLEMLAELSGEDEMHDLALLEKDDLEAQIEEIESAIKVELTPKDPNDKRNVVLEIRAGTGGDEASLFAAELFRMYNRYAELQNAGIPVAFHSAAEEGAIDLPLMASYAISQGMSPAGALAALTHAAAEMLAIDDRVGRLAPGLDADVLLLDGSPFDVSTGVLRVWVNGREVR